MILVRNQCWRVFVVVASMVGLPGGALAAEWFDDFNDGSATDGMPLTWIENLGLGNNNPPFPGDYNASSGDYVMTPPPGDGTDESTMVSFVPTAFSDLYIRTQGMVLPDPLDPNNVGGNLVLLGRLDPATVSGYLVYFDVSGNLNMQIIVGGVGTDIGTTFDAPFNAGSEVFVEMNIVGDQLSAFAWEANDPNGKPDEPQVTATDATFTSGLAGIAYSEDDDGTIGVFRFAAAQDTPFIDAAPGDYDGDSHVDGADFLIWQRDLGSMSNLAADGNGNGVVDAPDLDLWKMNFGAGAGAASTAAVPEPAALGAMLVAALVVSRARRRRSAVTGRRVSDRPPARV